MTRNTYGGLAQAAGLARAHRSLGMPPRHRFAAGGLAAVDGQAPADVDLVDPMIAATRTAAPLLPAGFDPKAYGFGGEHLFFQPQSLVPPTQPSAAAPGLDALSAALIGRYAEIGGSGGGDPGHGMPGNAPEGMTVFDALANVAAFTNPATAALAFGWGVTHPDAKNLGLLSIAKSAFGDAINADNFSNWGRATDTMWSGDPDGFGGASGNGAPGGSDNGSTGTGVGGHGEGNGGHHARGGLVQRQNRAHGGLATVHGVRRPYAQGGLAQGSGLIDGPGGGHPPKAKPVDRYLPRGGR